MTTWKSFQTRALSALAALAIIIGCYYFFQIRGLQAVIFAAVAMGSWELREILFNQESSKSLRNLILFLNLTVFAFSTLALNLSGITFSVAFIIFITASLLVLHKTGDLQRMARLQANGAISLFYMGLLPAFAYRLLDQAQGLSWFVYLLAVVFAGDTFAYVFGVLFGRHKVMPSVSPKKTWQGSMGGLVGSLAASAVCGYYLFPEISMSFLLPLAVCAGFAGQFGDFFESLLKRVADVKDSGKIMPGHGGVLDRIDGVLFAAPVVLVGVLILSHLSS
jgi:phosphatidate cytidylyltransferase